MLSEYYKSLDDAIISSLRLRCNRLALENLRLRQHLNRCRKDPDESNWIDKKNYMLSEQSMITRRIYYVQPGSSRFAIWITDLDLFPCISWLFEVD